MVIKNCLQPHKLYGNASVYHPDGHLMFKCSNKKAKWYLNKNLAHIVDINTNNKQLMLFAIDDALSIQLIFQPNGPGHKNPELLETLKNQCAVCGVDKNLIKQHILPHCYLMYYPESEKSHKFQHLVMLCENHSRLYNSESEKLSQSLALTCNAPIDGIGIIKDLGLFEAQKAAYALLNLKNQMPVAAIERRQQILNKYFGRTASEQELRDLFKQEYIRKENFKSHGQLIVEKLVDKHGRDEFIRMWNFYFAETMRPRFLPTYMKQYESKF